MPSLPDIMSNRASGPVASLARAGLCALVPFYAAAVAGRNTAFDLGLRKPRTLPRRTISVGNLTTGGTGKTPTVIALARMLQARGRKPAVLLRGYKAESTHAILGSDEAAVLARELPGVPVEPDPDRLAAAERVVVAHPEVDTFLLDDGFQHRQVARDVDLLLVDAVNPFGGGWQLPRGFLREPARNARRASAVVVTRSDLVTLEELAALDRTIEQLTGRLPLAHAEHRWTGLRNAGDEALDLGALRGVRVAAVSAIGNPEAFERTARSHGARVVLACRLPDHADFTRQDVDRLLEGSLKAGAELLLMTEKDWVKWRPVAGDDDQRPPVLRPVLEVTFTSGDIDRVLNG